MYLLGGEICPHQNFEGASPLRSSCETSLVGSGAGLDEKSLCMFRLETPLGETALLPSERPWFSPNFPVRDIPPKAWVDGTQDTAMTATSAAAAPRRVCWLIVTLLFRPIRHSPYE